MGDIKKGQQHGPNNEKEFGHLDKNQVVSTPFEASIVPQVGAGVVCNLGGLAWGMLMSWSATALPKLSDGSKNLGPVNDDMASWIGSIATLGACVTCIPSSILFNQWGRQKTMMTVAPIYTAGWLLIGFSSNISMLLIGRFMTGLAGGSLSIICPTYLAETTEPRVRGMLITGYDLLSSVGMLLSLVVGTYTSWLTAAIVSAAIPALFFVLLFFLPESPRFLLSKGRDAHASKSLMWHRGASHHVEIEPEFNLLKESMTGGINASWVSGFKQLTTRPVRMALLLSLLLFMFQTGTGIAAIMFYTVEIFETAGSSIDDYTSTIITGAVCIGGSLISALVVDRFGRRILLISSQLGVTLSLGALTGYFIIQNLKGAEFASSNLGWLPLMALIIHLVTFSTGIGPIPYSIMPEMLPQHVRGLAASVVMTCKWGFTFVVTRFFKSLMTWLGLAGGYWFFASICLIGLWFIYFFVPETKQKSLEEIQTFFYSKKKPQNAHNI